MGGPPRSEPDGHLPICIERRNGEGRAPIVFTLDVAGQDEATFHNPEEQVLRNPGRDAVSLTIAAVDLSEMGTLQAPIFRILQREQWTGLNHLAVFGKLIALADQWGPQYIVIDATGVGEGLWAMLDKRYPTRILPVKFSAQKKSELGYRFLAMIETGRLRDCCGERASGPHRPLGPKRDQSHRLFTDGVIPAASLPRWSTNNTPPACPKCCSDRRRPCAGASPRAPATRMGS